MAVNRNFITDDLLQFSLNLAKVVESDIRSAGLNFEAIWRNPEALPADFPERAGFLGHLFILRQLNQSFGHSGPDNTFSQLTTALENELTIRNLPIPEVSHLARLIGRTIPIDLNTAEGLRIAREYHPTNPLQALNDLIRFIRSRRETARYYQLAAPPEAVPEEREMETPPSQATVEAESPFANLNAEITQYTKKVTEQVIQDLTTIVPENDDVRNEIAQLTDPERTAEQVIAKKIITALQTLLETTGEYKAAVRAVAATLKVNIPSLTDKDALSIAEKSVSVVKEQTPQVATAYQVLKYARTRDDYLDASKQLFGSLAQAINSSLNNLGVSLTAEQEQILHQSIPSEIISLIASHQITPEMSDESVAGLIQATITATLESLVTQPETRQRLGSELTSALRQQQNLERIAREFTQADIISNLRQGNTIYTQHAQLLANPRIQMSYIQTAATTEVQPLQIAIKQFIRDGVPTLNPRQVESQTTKLTGLLQNHFSKTNPRDRSYLFTHMGLQLQLFMTNLTQQGIIDPEVTRAIQSYLASGEDLPFIEEARTVLLSIDLDAQRTGQLFTQIELGVQKLIRDSLPDLPPQVTTKVSKSLSRQVIDKLTASYQEEPTAALAHLRTNLDTTLASLLESALPGEEIKSLTSSLKAGRVRETTDLSLLINRYLNTLPGPKQVNLEQALGSLKTEVILFLGANTSLTGPGLDQTAQRFIQDYISRLINLAGGGELLPGSNFPRQLEAAFEKSVGKVGLDAQIGARVPPWFKRHPNLLQVVTNITYSIPRGASQIKKGGWENTPVTGQAFEFLYHLATLDLAGLGAWALKTVYTPLDFVGKFAAENLADRFFQPLADNLVKEGFSKTYAEKCAKSALAIALDGLPREELLRNIHHLTGEKHIPGIPKPDKPYHQNDPYILHLKNIYRSMELMDQSTLGRFINFWNKINTGIGRWPRPLQHVWAFKSILLFHPDYAFRLITEWEVKHAVKSGLWWTWRKTVGHGLNRLGLALGLYEEVPTLAGLVKIKFTAHKKLWKRLGRPLIARLIMAIPKPYRQPIVKFLKQVGTKLLTLFVGAATGIGLLITVFRLFGNKIKKVLQFLGMLLFSFILEYGAPALFGALGGLITGAIIGSSAGPLGAVVGAVGGFLAGLFLGPRIIPILVNITSAMSGFVGRILGTTPGFSGVGGAIANAPVLVFAGSAVGIPLALSVLLHQLLQPIFFTPQALAGAELPPEFIQTCQIKEVHDVDTLDNERLTAFINEYSEKFPNSKITDAAVVQAVVGKSIAAGWNPALTLAIWGGESHFSNYGETTTDGKEVIEGNDFGCGANCPVNKPINFGQSLACFVRDESISPGCIQQCHEFDNFLDFAECYGPKSENPNFVPNVLRFYAKLDPDGIECAGTIKGGRIAQAAFNLAGQLGYCKRCDNSTTQDNNTAPPEGGVICYCPRNNIEGSGWFCRSSNGNPNYHCWLDAEKANLPGNGSGDKYYLQCTEFVNEVYRQATGKGVYDWNGPNLGNAAKWFTDANDDIWLKINNQDGNARFLQPGDIIVYKHGIGHVQIVTETDPYGVTVKIAQANTLSSLEVLQINTEGNLVWGNYQAEGFLRLKGGG